MSKHVNGTLECPSCEQKLLQAHPDLVEWYRELIKPKFQDCHISWSFRDKTNQNQCYAEGKSKLPWPMSMHNKCDDQGNPCSMALDLFRLCSNGMASWEWKYFRQISDLSTGYHIEIDWGGLWKSISDSDHYQLKKG